MTDSLTEQPDFVELAADIVAAYVTKNSVRPGELPELIASVHAALCGVGLPKPEDEKPTPKVDPKKSVRPDYLISLETGQRFKAIKRHLRTLGLTPEQYRAKWGLPHDYPMVAANYAAKRSELAKQIGLGQFRKKAAKAVGKRGGTVEKVLPSASKKVRSKRQQAAS